MIAPGKNCLKIYVNELSFVNVEPLPLNPEPVNDYMILYHPTIHITDLGNHRLNKNAKSLIIQVFRTLHNDLLDRHKQKD